MPHLQDPTCLMGYTDDDVNQALAEFGIDQDDFTAWYEGQTGAICDGQQYDYDAKAYRTTPCAENPHGFVVYGHDLRRFLAIHEARRRRQERDDA